jgi:hypothetical protein
MLQVTLTVLAGRALGGVRSGLHRRDVDVLREGVNGVDPAPVGLQPLHLHELGNVRREEAGHVDHGGRIGAEGRDVERPQ